MTTIAMGTNMETQPMSQTESELGPAAAAVATHCRFVHAIVKKSATSNSVRQRLSCTLYTIYVFGGEDMRRMSRSIANGAISSLVRPSIASSLRMRPMSEANLKA